MRYIGGRLVCPGWFVKLTIHAPDVPAGIMVACRETMKVPSGRRW